MQGKKKLKERTSSSEPKKRTSKKKKGRPSLFEEKVIPLMKNKTKKGTSQLEELGADGYTDQQLASFLGVTRDCVTKWKEKFPAFADELQKGKDIADGKVVRSLFERAMGYEHPEEKIFCSEGEIIRADTVKKYPPDTSAIIWWTKNRMGWVDKHDFNLFDDVEINVEIVPRNSDSGSADVKDSQS